MHVHMGRGTRRDYQLTTGAWNDINLEEMEMENTTNTAKEKPNGSMHPIPTYLCNGRAELDEQDISRKGSVRGMHGQKDEKNSVETPKIRLQVFKDGEKGIRRTTMARAITTKFQETVGNPR